MPGERTSGQLTNHKYNNILEENVMEKNQMEITITISKTIQEKQFEPLVISLSATMVADEENVEQDYKDGMSFLESVIEEKFQERGIKW